MSEIEAENGIPTQDLSQNAESMNANIETGASVINPADANDAAASSKAHSATMDPSAPPNATPTKTTPSKSTTPRKPRGPTKAQQVALLYSNPLPLKTFPLPTIIPHNPLSVLTFLLTWASQVFSPPTSHPYIYVGTFSSSLRAVHVTDPISIRALWEQGFYGKGSLSRSELSWLEREKRRIGEGASKTSEEVTRQRRAERQQVKWERARVQQEAIEAKRQEEARNGEKADKVVDEIVDEVVDAVVGHIKPIIMEAPTGPMQILSMPNSVADIKMNGHLGEKTSTPATSDAQAPSPSDVRSVDSTSLSPSPSPPTAINTGISSGKNVRFSTAVDTRTIPASTLLSTTTPSNLVLAIPDDAEELPLVIRDKEHLQLTTEEAFFLHYGLGVLSIISPSTNLAIPTPQLLEQFRRASYFPSLGTGEGEGGPLAGEMQRPDDNFMINYVVYHHFRSLGWVVRGGVKFGVDYLLYNRGPVFSHAEFAVMILPSYSDEYWKGTRPIPGYPEGTRVYTERKLRQRGKWSWLHAVNRVNAQVKKTLVLVYVDVPAPLGEEKERGMGIDEILATYNVREIVLKRWVSNRSRD